MALIIGLVFLGVGAALDRRGYAGAATPFVAVGAIETLAGAIVLGGNDSVLLGGLLAITAGAVVGLVGGHGDRRRATTWIGAIAVFGGCVAVISDIAPSSAAGVGGIAFGFALVLGSIAWWLAPILGEPDDGDDRPRPTAPPGGSSQGATESGTATLPDAAAGLIHCPVAFAERKRSGSEFGNYSLETIPAMSSPASVGFSPTSTPGVAQRLHLRRRGALAAGDDGAGVAHLLAGGAVTPGDVRRHRLRHRALDELGRLFLGRTADLADHHHGLGLGVGLERARGSR